MQAQHVFLNLFHGRSDPYAEMEDWGELGPILGPLKYVHVTYNSYIHISFDGADFDLTFTNDCVAYDGAFYGDFSVFAEATADDPDVRSRREDPAVSMAKLIEQRR
jgi:hypothetical protein